MRILFTLPHYFRPSRRGFHGSEQDAAERVASLRRCLSALHQHFGAGSQGMLDGPSRQVLPVNEGRAHELRVVVCTNEQDHLLGELPDGLCSHAATGSSPQLLGYECHKVLQKGHGHFDFFCYLEDDTLLSDPLFFQKLLWFNDLAGEDALLQPNRYELSSEPHLHKVYVDGNLVNPAVSPRLQDRTEDPEIRAALLGEDLSFRRIDNPHAGCFFLNAAQMDRWAEAPYFLDFADNFWGPLESAATLGIMRTFKVYKPAPENADFLEVEHLDPRYELRGPLPSNGESASLTFAVRSRVKAPPDLSKSCQMVTLLPPPPYTRAQVAQWTVQGIHCGSGLNLRERWVNTDLLCLTDADGRTTEPGRLAQINERFLYLQHDAAEPYPFEAGSFQWAYAEHLLEHLSLKAAITWLKDVHRLVRPGGGVRLSTPDLHRYVQGYLNPSDSFYEQHRAHLKKLGIQDIPQRRAWMINQIFHNWGHQWIYDLDEIRFVARLAGFDPDKVVACRFQQGRAPAVAALDLPVRSDESLYAELTR